MTDIDKFIPSIEKFLENFLLKPIEGDYDMEIVKYHRYNRPILQINVQVDVSKMISSSPEHDSAYESTMYNLEDIGETLLKYLGISHTDLDVSFTPYYYNTGILDGEVHSILMKNIEKYLLDNGMSKQQIDDYELWANIYYREDDYPWMNLEVGSATGIKDEDHELVETAAYDALSKTEHIKHIVDNDISFWLNY